MNKVLDFLKKQSVSTYLTLAAFILALVAMSVYCANGNVEGYFKGTNPGGIITFSVFSVILLAIVLVLTQVNVENKTVMLVIRICSDILKVVSAVFMIVVMMNFIQTRLNGLSYIFFSNDSVKQEVATPINLASAYTAIAGFVIYVIAWLVALVNVYFSFRPVKK